MTKAPLAVIILANNEEANIGECLTHVLRWAAEVFVLDSGSTDGTMEIARKMGATVVEHAFPGYSQQRNWALNHLPIKSEWMFFIDADEYPTEELKAELSALLAKEPLENGFYVKRRFIWEGAWIRHGGYYPVWLLRVFRRTAGRWDETVKMDEHAIVSGNVGRLEHDLMHEDRRGLAHWREKHRQYSVLKAKEYCERRRAAGTGERTAGDAEHEKRMAKRSLYDKLPLYLRTVLYFKYVFFLRGGFLDGPVGWRYHWLRSLWYPWNIDREIARMKK